MLIRSEHARILLELLEHRSSEGYTFSPEQINNEAITELILAGMIRKLTPSSWLLTYHGARLAEAIDKLTRENYVQEQIQFEEEKDQKVILEQNTLNSPEEWQKEFRLIGSEVINLLDAAERAGRVGPEGELPLLDRGLAARIRWEKRKVERVELTEAGKQILDIYRYINPILQIDASLAERLLEKFQKDRLKRPILLFPLMKT